MSDLPDLIPERPRELPGGRDVPEESPVTPPDGPMPDSPPKVPEPATM